MSITTISINGQESGWTINATSEDLTTSGRLLSASSKSKSITIRQVRLAHSATAVVNYSLASKESASASLANFLDGMPVVSGALPSGLPWQESFINPIKLPQGHALFVSATAKAITHIFAAGDFV